MNASVSASESFTARLGLQLPLIQAPMAGVATPELAAAVSNAGGLGSLGLGASNPAQAEALIRQTRTLTGHPFNVNLFCHQPAVRDAAREAAWLAHLAGEFQRFGASPPASLESPYPTLIGNTEMLELLLREKPAVVSFHFGLPEPHAIAALRAAGIVTLASVTNPAEAAQAEQAGVDVLVAQGIEAGGHRGIFDAAHDLGLGVFALVPLLLRETRLPVVAAGGIMDGHGMAAALRLGAAAVQMGTAFILCPESSASAAYRQELQSPRSHHTAITAAISGRPARGIANRLHALAGDDAPAIPDYPVAYAAAKALHQAASAQDSHDYAAHWAGQGAPLARALPAAELVQRIAREWQEQEAPKPE
ncbi:nitronate monooxygenase [Corticibacter populi]|uniref:Nitronate monooxygenase n=1 Tax=Corticibacter populi TaxID=1550736 RepID=A0A3M6QZD4_9BURK|nr:nitronate monooxygenase [Corticibacter populi]RMX08370.1 nitronate monooxygenase [Corticibacter populi]RZS35664.1 nitronate monooxygenase [Corticibacter populi]